MTALLEHTTTVHESSEHEVLIAQGWEEVAVYEDPQFQSSRAVMVRLNRAAMVAEENAWWGRGYDTARSIYGRAS